MDLAVIQRLLAAGESETVEFKKSTAQLTRTAETLCAFLNATGGTVIIGVTPDGKLEGQQVADSTLRDIANLLQRFEPPAPVEIMRVPLPGTDRELLVLRATVFGETLPFTFDGRPYQRIGPTTGVMPPERYRQLLLGRLHAQQRWENIPAQGVSLDSLDQEEILRTVRSGIAVRRLPEATGSDPEDILNRLGLRLNGQLLNAAVVLFGTQFLPNYPQCALRMARFRGTTKREFIDNRQIFGHAFQVLDEAMFFMQRHLPVAGRIEPGRIERVDEPLFPLAALREAMVNAICHRNYINAGGAVSLAIYDDRLEIESEGTLPFGLRVEDLKRSHASRPRNPIIADVFYRRGLIEKWGRGTQDIVELCVQAGHPEPEFEEQAGTLVVRFLPSGYTPPHRVSHDLTPRQREILQLLARAPQLALREIRGRLSQPPADRTLRDDLLLLKRLGLIGSTGYGRGAAWFLEGVKQ